MATSYYAIIPSDSSTLLLRAIAVRELLLPCAFPALSAELPEAALSTIEASWGLHMGLESQEQSRLCAGGPGCCLSSSGAQKSELCFSLPCSRQAGKPWSCPQSLAAEQSRNSVLHGSPGWPENVLGFLQASA